MVQRSAEIAHELWKGGASYVIENPVSRYDMSDTRFYQGKWAQHAPLWIMEEIVQLKRDTRAHTVDFVQCAPPFNGKYQKATTLMYTADMADLADLAQMRCTHKTHEKVARGRIQGKRAYASAAAAAYPARMNERLIAEMAAAHPVGEVQRRRDDGREQPARHEGRATHGQYDDDADDEDEEEWECSDCEEWREEEFALDEQVERELEDKDEVTRPTANGAPTPDEAHQSDTNEDAEEDHSSGSDTSDDGAGPAELNGAAQPKGKARWGVTRAKADRIGRLRWLASKWTELKGRAKEYHGHRWQKYHIPRGMQARSRISMQPELLAVMQAGGMTHEERRTALVTICERKILKYERRLTRAEGAHVHVDEIEAEMREVITRTSTGGVVHGIFDILARAMGKRGREGAGKLVEINGVTTDVQGEIVRGAAPVRAQAHAYGEANHREGWASTVTATRIMKELWTTCAGRREGQGLDEALEWTNFQRSLARSEAAKGVGADGFNSYALRRAPENIQREYWQLLVTMVRTADYPAEYKQWVAMLASKGADEDPRDISRRRDLWVVCHGQKLIMRMINKEYERVARASVPLSQAGFAPWRNAPEQALVIRLVQEQHKREQKMLCIGLLDLGTFFMSCVRDVQWECEKWTGVDTSVTRVVQALHSEVQGQYETQWGLTDPFGIHIGNGQGCVNGAVRSKLLLTVMQRAIRKLCKGWQLEDDGTGRQQTLPNLWYADDSSLLSDSVAGLQLAFDCCWCIAKIAGLRVMVKGKKKTAFMATYWQNGVQRDVDIGADCAVKLPDGTMIPQIFAGDTPPKRATWTVASASKQQDTATQPTQAAPEVRTYRYLGTEIAPLWQHGREATREEVRKTCIQVVRMAGRIPLLNNDQLRRVTNAALSGIIGYRGRGTALRWTDCVAIEAARALALRQRGFAAPAAPSLHIYAPAEAGGLGHTHARAGDRPSRAATCVFRCSCCPCLRPRHPPPAFLPPPAKRQGGRA